MNIFNRRDFLKVAGAAAGGLVLSPGMLSRQRKGGDKVNVAVVGYGAEGEVLMNSLLKLPYINFVAICDIWQPRCNYAAATIMRQLKQKPARYTINIDGKDPYAPLVKKGRIGEVKGENYKDLIKNHAHELDAVVIATPDFWHAPMTVDFLNAGVNVLLRKDDVLTPSKAPRAWSEPPQERKAPPNRPPEDFQPPLYLRPRRFASQAQHLRQHNGVQRAVEQGGFPGSNLARQG